MNVCSFIGSMASGKIIGEFRKGATNSPQRFLGFTFEQGQTEISSLEGRMLKRECRVWASTYGKKFWRSSLFLRARRSREARAFKLGSEFKEKSGAAKFSSVLPRKPERSLRASSYCNPFICLAVQSSAVNLMATNRREWYRNTRHHELSR